MIRVGIAGLGFMGKMHFKCYQGLEDVKIAAIFDTDENKLKDTGGTAGNIEGAEEPLNLTDIEFYSNFDKMLTEANLDAVSITLPTYMHLEYTIKALGAGINVLCEKPMARTVDECEKMLAAAEKSGKILQIGHCIRFWPEYAKAKEIIDSGEYGKVKAAIFQRLSLTPDWSWDSWLMDGNKSGGAAFDLHIHDSDFVQYVFAMPKAVRSFGVKGPSSDFDHIVTNYIYDDGKVITAQGGWMMTDSFGFEMSFNIMLDRAVIAYDCTREPAFKICPSHGDVITPELAAGDGYLREITHFAQAAAGRKVPTILTPQQSRDSVRLITAEKESAQTQREVSLMQHSQSDR